jgi:integrase
VERALIEPSNGTLVYGPTKNGESRTVHLSSDVLIVVQSHLEDFVGPEDNAPLFPGSTGRPVRPGAFWRAWNKARSTTGITEYRFHDLRHFAATAFSSTGASMSEVMARGGWKSPAMVSRYQHATPHRDAELAKSLPRLVSLEPASDMVQTATSKRPFGAQSAQIAPSDSPTSPLTRDKAPGERLELST